MQQGSNF